LTLNACGADLSPAALAAAFDDPTTEDDDGCPSSAPTPECEEYNEGYELAYPHYFIGSPCNNDLHAQKVDNNVCNIYATYTDLVIEACGDNACGGSSGSKVIRTWTLLDWCAAAAGAPASESTAEYVQVIKVVDLEAPSITMGPQTFSTNPWGCTATFPIPEPQLHDNCDGNIEWSFHGPAGTQTVDTDGDGVDDTVTGAPKGDHIFTYTASDCCGNVSTLDVMVTIVDNAPPVAIATSNITVSLTSSGSDPDGFAKIFNYQVDNGSFDGCTGVKLEIRRDTDVCGFSGNNTYNADNHPNDGSSNPNSPLFDNDGGEFVRFCCEDAGTMVKVWLRVWDDGDMDGTFGSAGDNYNETWVNVLVEDKGNPVIYCPPDFTITCGWEWGQYDAAGNLVSTNTGSASAFDICGEREVVADVNDRTNDCGVGEIEIEWCSVPQGNENPVCCEQVITVTDGGSSWDPNDIDFQNDRVLGCVDIPDPEKPEWGEGLCDLIAWTSEDLTLYFEEDACYKVIRTYTVVNWCTDETVTEEVYFTVLDETPPVVECEDQMFGIFEGCSTNVSLSKSAVDGDSDCSSAWLEWKAEVDLWGDGTIDYTWSFAEGADEGFNEDRDNDGDGIYYLEKQTDVTINIPEAINSSCNNHTVTWTVNDGCNNVTSCTETFMVVDKKAPTPYCISVSSAVMVNGEVELWASDFDLGATDNCTPQEDLLFSFSGTAYEPNRTFTCADDADGDGIVQVAVYVWDNACTPNNDFCNVTLTLSNCGDGGVPIAGRVATEYGEEVTNVDVTIDSDGVINYPMTYATDNAGDYAFGDNPLTLDYSVSGERNDDYMNGVSTLDLVLIQKHILTQQLLDSPYKMIAADINSTGNISAIDLVELRKLILGIYDELPNNDSWRFVDADQNLTVANPWVFTEVIDVNNLSTSMMNENFVGVKIGDVNGSVTANATSVSTENRSSDALTLEIMERELQAGETAVVAFMSSNFADVYGYQLTMSFDGVTVTDVAAGKLNMTAGNVAMSANSMTMSYHNVAGEAVNATANEVLFTLEVTANRAGKLSEMMSANSSIAGI